MFHNFSQHTTASLVALGASLKATLRNPQCVAITQPVGQTLRQIRRELNKRAKPQTTHANT